jgi:hypothetical protein
MPPQPFILFFENNQFLIMFISGILAIIGFILNRSMLVPIRISLIIPIVFSVLVLVFAQLNVYDMALRDILIKISLTTILISMAITNFIWYVNEKRDILTKHLAKLFSKSGKNNE